MQKLAERKYLATLTQRPEKHLYGSVRKACPSSSTGDMPRKTWPTSGSGTDELKQLGMKHFLHVATIHTRLILLTRPGPIELAHWQEGPTLWDHSTVDGRELPVRPDAWFTLRHTGRPEGRNKAHYFLEADRSTMAHSRMELKVKAYRAYHEQQRYALKYPGMETFWVATVTETRGRAKELQQDLHELLPTAKARRAYLFIPIEDLTLDALLPAPA